MALNKQTLNINFAQGLDQKTDPYQVAQGKYLSLENSVFDKVGRLTKRNGFGKLPSLPDTTSRYLTTFNGNLTAIGTDLKALSEASNRWVTKGQLQPIKLSVNPIVRASASEIQADSVTASNGTICVVYTEAGPSGNLIKYSIYDSVTTQNLIAPTLITDADPTLGTPRVFLLGNYFVILYTTLVLGSYNLKYMAISVYDPSIVTISATLASGYTPASTLAFDALVVGTSLYFAYNTLSGGQNVKVGYLTATGSIPTPLTLAGSKGTMFTLGVDNTVPSSPMIYVSFYDSVSQDAYTAIIDKNLGVIEPPTQTINNEDVTNITTIPRDGSIDLVYEINNAYTFDAAIKTHYIKSVSFTQAGTVGTPGVLVRDLGLASKAFVYNDVGYFLTVQSSTYQPTYFLINEDGQVIAKLAYGNAGGYHLTGISNVSLIDGVAQIPYLYKALTQAASKAQGLTTTGVYAQLGINLVKFDLNVSSALSAEIGQALNITGGFLWNYDGVLPNENNFFLFPEDNKATPATAGGFLADQQYFYQICYEWTDNQGMLIRSAPSIPLSAIVSGGAGAGSVTLNIPTLRLTYKITTPVRIVIYRWSTAQQIYYQVTSITQPLLNNTAVDSITYVDTLSDATISGSNILYTTGGVVENLSPPSPSLVTLFNNRLWMLDSEDRNLLYFSKQVIEATPVEMSDLLTVYVAPSTASQGSTGPITALAPMDDKLVIFKNNALGFINGVGPDNTGANSQYADFVLINSVVGCENQRSIVFTPQGLMFQSSKGIWVVGRDLSTQYIGAAVEDFTRDALVVSAENIPETNQVRFELDSGITLMYDYYMGQWGTFTGIPAVSSTLYENLHTYINKFGRVFQETPGLYLDDTKPVLMKFSTSWLNLAGVQGLQRFYDMYILGRYLSPFKLNIEMAYDYNPAVRQATIISPNTPGPLYGGDQLWGSNELWGGVSNIFEARISPIIQQCESFQITVSEIAQPLNGQVANAGLTLSGMNLVLGMKRGYRLSSASRNFG